MFKQENELIIKLKDNTSVKNGATLRAYISCDYLSYIEASGATNISLRNTLVSNDLDIDISGASNLNGTIEVGEITAEVSGASVLELSGTSGYFYIDASGASTIKDYSFSIGHLNAELSGASNANLTVNNRIEVEASGASTLNYKGDAIIQQQELSGASSVNRVR